ncbi:MAG: hypothetical protein M0Q88_00195 [Bacilli bacterium]|nr:hypothetical protein [Bacilli bacterium]
MKLKVKNIPNCSILWEGDNVLGIKGVDLPKEYYEYECYHEKGNLIDFTIIIPIKNIDLPVCDKCSKEFEVDV